MHFSPRLSSRQIGSGVPQNRLLKVRFEYVLLSIVGCISDGPTAALIASSAQWKTLINIGLLMGVLAGALGNYVGIGVAYAIRAFIGA